MRNRFSQNVSFKWFSIAFFTLVTIVPVFSRNGGILEELSSEKRPNFFQTRSAVHRYYHGREGRKPGYKQFLRWEWFARARLDSNGYINSKLHWQGYLEKKQRFGLDKTGSSNWQPLDMKQIPENVNSPGGMGRLNCIEFDPVNRDIIWVGAPTGGLWKTVDGGQNWTTTTDSLPNLGVSDILINPQNRDIMYIATGDKGRSSSLSSGIMKSTDRGNTWAFTGLNADVTEMLIVYKMMLDPRSPETIITSTSSGVYKSIDGGSAWTKTADGIFNDIEVHPIDRNTWYASAAHDGVYRSTDSGDTWTRMGPGLPQQSMSVGRVVLAVTPASPDLLYALYTENIVGQGWEWGFYGLYRSTDRGETWTKMSDRPNILGWSENGNDSGGQGGFALIFDVHPEQPGVVFAGSVNLWKSVNSGSSWECISNYGGGTRLPQVHSDQHDFAFAPGDPNILFSANDGGLYKSENGGNSWTDLSTGLVIQQVYRIGVSSNGPSLLVTGNQDNGTALLNQGIWQSIGGGDGCECMIDPQDSNIIYFSSQFGRFSRSDNRGRGSHRIGYPERGAWLMPIRMDPANSSTLYLAGSRVYKSTNRGEDWEAISTVLSGIEMTSLEIAPADSNTILTSNGRQLFKTSDGGQNWVTLEPGLSPDMYITHIKIHPNNPRHIWLSFGGYGRWNSHFAWNGIPYLVEKPRVYFSADGGTTWSDISGQLPGIPVNCMAVDPFSMGLYIGTDLGVFYSSTGRGEWERYDNGLPNVIITELEVQPNTGQLIAATYGRGVWLSPLASVNGSYLYPPANFSGRYAVNKSLLGAEYISILTWTPNSLNQNRVTGYRLYLVNGNNRTLLQTPDRDTREFNHRSLTPGTYSYALTAVDRDNKESNPLNITVHIEGNQ